MPGAPSAVLESMAAQLAKKIGVRVEKDVSKFLQIAITRHYESRVLRYLVPP